MDDESQFPVPPEVWPELVAAPYCMLAGCPNPASHVQLSHRPQFKELLHVQALCKWHAPLPTQAHETQRAVLSIDEYRKWRAGARVRAALQRPSELNWVEVETLIDLIAGKLQWGAAVSVALEELKARRFVSGPPYAATSSGRCYVAMALTQPGVISPSLLTGAAHVCGLYCEDQDGHCDMARRPPQTSRELAQLPRQPR